MVTNQRNYSILLTALVYCCCCILDLGVSYPRYKTSTYFKHYNGNNNKRTTEMNNNMINEERYFNLSECKPIMIKRMKQFSQDNDQCNKTNMINDLKGEVAYLWCHAGSLLLKKNKQYNFAKHHDHGRHQLDNINQTYEFKPINQKIYSRMLESNDLLSRLQSDYVNSTNSYKKGILRDVERLINLLKSHVLKKILFNAGCAEIDLCENINKINHHGKKKKQQAPSTKTEIRINQRYHRILKTIYDHLSESLRLIFSHRNEEFDPELIRGQCSQPHNLM